MKSIKIFIAIIVLLTSSMSAQSLIYFDLSELMEIKDAYRETGEYKNEIETLKGLADLYLNRGPFTITKYKSPINEAVHDYFSESPYWWPVPGDPTAPYTRKDGVRNPDRFLSHKDEVKSFYTAVISSAFTSFFSDDPKYTEAVNNLLRVWFIDDSTKMNPNLKYSQMIRNRTKPRGVGIIEGRRIAFMVEAINLLELSGKLDKDIYVGLQEWYGEYLIWMTESFYGVDEKRRGNNHSSWWAAQVAAISSFINDVEEINELEDYTKHYLLDRQFIEGARQPLEEARTKSLSYSIFNVTALTMLNLVLANYNIDCWNYVNVNGVKLLDAVDYLIPFTEDPSKWKLVQLEKVNNRYPAYLGFTGIKLNNVEYLGVYNKLSSYNEDDFESSSFDPLQIILNLVVENRLRK